MRKFRHKAALGLVTGQGSQLLMNLFMMWMAGTQSKGLRAVGGSHHSQRLHHPITHSPTHQRVVNMWSIFMVAAMAFSPIKSLLGIQTSQSRFAWFPALFSHC